METEAKIAFVAATLVVEQMPLTAFNHSGIRGDPPNKVDADYEYKLGNSVSVTEMRCSQVKAVAVEIAIEFFSPHADAIKVNQRASIYAVGKEKPRFFCPIGSVNRQPVRTSTVLSRELHPADPEVFARLDRHLAYFDSRLTR